MLRQFVNCSEQVFQTCAELNGLIYGRLKIGSYYSLASHKLPPLIEQFNTLYPGIQIDWVEDGLRNLFLMLKENRLDCCFVGEPLAPEIDFLPLMGDKIVAWLPPNHPLAQETAFPIRELEHEPFIAMASEKRDIVGRILDKCHFKLNIRYTTQEACTAYRMVEAGLGISANNFLTNKEWGGWVAVLPFAPPETVMIGAAMSKNSRPSPAVVRLVDFMKEHWDE